MLAKLFPRLFGQYREGGIITARWQHTAAGSVWTRLSPTRYTSYQAITVADRGTGLITVGFPACTDAAVLSMRLEALGDAAANLFEVTNRLITPGTGTFQAVIRDAATDGVVDPPDAAILCITMYVNK